MTIDDYCNIMFHASPFLKSIRVESHLHITFILHGDVTTNVAFTFHAIPSLKSTTIEAHINIHTCVHT
jgi:hypothetical protein